ncbi:hypothetical protein Ahy_B04g070739 isoform B [Arachis hypogaea]|uniref:Pyruvate kinase n=1 Tax=Arachis hypogaea TaxID=3818 RepID=A0A444ZJB7_ARAHY|nr:hypothetical protein Ahy_B04g070739 isoform B [Arachis hypogaea]
MAFAVEFSSGFDFSLPVNSFPNGGLTHFDEVLREADGIIQSRGNLGIDLPPEKVFLFRKSALYKCNMAGKPAVLTRVVDSMTDNLRPTRAEATDVANAVLDGSDAILLGVETLRGLYPIETISTFGRICSERLKEINSWRWGSRSIFGGICLFASWILVYCLKLLVFGFNFDACNSIMCFTLLLMYASS